ncbi:MAG: HNH endonuclease signature motif containing protein [Firmicutes bacterium]|nr:HNH endonuclease signature motif containing protein [Bacillota bacterium]
MDMALVESLIAIQMGRCFICDEALDPSIDEIHIDHVIPRAKGGKDDPNNYAVTHAHCNLHKLDADLRIARSLSRYERLKDRYASQGPNRPNLGDFLTDLGGSPRPIGAMRSQDELMVWFPPDDAKKIRLPIYHDKLSNMDSVFLTVPLEYLHHDQRINPRAVGPRIRGLLNEFLSGKPQLHVALAWGVIEDNKLQVQVFDGQHKLVSQLLLGVRQFPIRLFLNPDVNLLLEANTHAGTTLRQIAFDQSTQRFLGSQLYWEKIDAFREATGRSSNDLGFSEQDLVQYFRGERREVARYILDDVRIGIIHHPENTLKDYIEFSGREGDKPLSYNTIEKTAFSLFLRKTPLGLPLNYKLELDENPRQLEKEQIVRLFGILAQTVYIGHYDFDVGANKLEERVRKGHPVPEGHLRAVRISREEVLFNLMRYVRDLVRRHFLMQGHAGVEDDELFERKFPEELWALLERLIRNLSQLPVWVNPSLSGSVFGSTHDHDYWKIVFETGQDRLGTKVLARPLNLDELIR